MFTKITDKQILDGTATDAYFLRTEDALNHVNKNPMVIADISADQFGDSDFEVLAGLNDAVELLNNIPSNNIDAWALPEGTLFDGGPVMRIRGPYLDFAKYETSLLGFLSHASGISTNAFNVMQEANKFDDLQVLSFGARHAHPKLAGIIERGAMIAGLDGFSHVAAGNELGLEASGTMPHALVIALDNQEEAWSAYNESAHKDVPRVVLTDTFTDESDESLRAAELLGSELDGVRLDTTGSRRGSFRHIIKEVRWKLDAEGHGDVGIFISGGLGPEDVRELGDIVDGVGVGGYISNADPVDFSLDIVELDGEPTTKRGKLPGIKAVYQENGEHIVEPATEIDEGIFEQVVKSGNSVQNFTIENANNKVEESENIIYGDN